MILPTGWFWETHTANRHNYRSGQSLKAIVQVEVEAIAEVIVNAWPFQWRQVDTWLRKYIYPYIYIYIVILDRNDYIDKVERDLNYGSFDILGSDPWSSYYHIVKDWGDKWVEKGEITQPLVDCILNVNARPGKNYGLIKTHKPNNPIRLITSGNGTAAENLSLLTEYFLHSCVKKEPQILIDTTALLNKVTEINNKFSPFPAGTLLVSWDVISMYPSIDNKVSLPACKEALDRREHTSPSTECLLEAIKITLECNNSIFNKKHYRQNRGTAMGPHNACSYADLTMTTIDRIFDVNNRPDDVLFPPD